MNEVHSYHTERVHKVNLILIFIIDILVVIPNIVNIGWAHSLPNVMAGMVVMILAMTNYYLRIPTYVKGFIFASMPNVIIYLLFYLDQFSLNKHYILLLSIAMVSLYFKSELILSFSLLINVEYILAYLIHPGFLGINGNFEEFIAVLFTVNGVLALLYYLTCWGRDLIQVSYEKEVEAKHVLAKLQRIFHTIEKSGVVLENNVKSFNEIVDHFYESSKVIKESLEQMTAGIQEQANSVNYVSETMLISSEKAIVQLKFPES